MTRRAGQLTTRQALLGVLALLAAVGAVVAGCRVLLLPIEQVGPLPAEPAPFEAGAVLGTVTCPEPPAGTRSPRQVSSAELYDCPRLYDGQRVTYAGEVVGAVLRRGDRAWLQVNDDPYAETIGPLPRHRTGVGGNSGVAVSVPVEVGADISRVGGHRAHGDGIVVSGVFHRADPRDGGGPTVQAERVDIVRAGTPTSHPVSLPRMIVAGTLGVITAALAAAVVLRQRAF